MSVSTKEKDMNRTNDFQLLYEAASQIKGILGRKVDDTRLYKAVEIVEKGIPIKSEYASSTTYCGCIDHYRHPRSYCKHMLARMIEQFMGKGCKHTDTVIEHGLKICMDCLEQFPELEFSFL